MPYQLRIVSQIVFSLPFVRRAEALTDSCVEQKKASQKQAEPAPSIVFFLHGGVRVGVIEGGDYAAEIGDIAEQVHAHYRDAQGTQHQHQSMQHRPD